MTLGYVSLVSLVKLHDTVDPSSFSSFKYKKKGKMWLQTITEQGTSVAFSHNKSTMTQAYSYSKYVMNFKALSQTIA